MKKSILFTFLLVLVSTFSFASFPVLENTNNETVLKSEISFPVSDIAEDKNTSFIDKVKNLISRPGGMEWGSFLMGFLFSWVGVLLVWIFEGDVKSAWKGAGVAIILYLLLYMATVGAIVATV